MTAIETDPDTGLMLEKAFFRRVASSILNLAPRASVQPTLAVLSVSLDLTSTVEASEPISTPDLYRLAAERIQGACRLDDTVSLQEQGCFRILLEPLNHPEVAASLAAKFCQVLRKPFVVNRQTVKVSASVGISLFPADGASAARLAFLADKARAEAAGAGGNCYRFSDVGLDPGLSCHPENEDNPREAMQRGEFELFYQPRISLHTNDLVGAEALLRWQHPSHGMIGPVELIAIAESTGLIHDLGIWVLRQACRQAVHWFRQGYSPLLVSVNVSPRQLDNPDFAQQLGRVLLETGMPPNALELEITEQAMMRDPEQVIATLRDIRARGVCVALDDFGTGYSSLAYLRRFPLDTLKIDRRFLVDVAGDRCDEIILQSIVELAHALGLNVVAEGVETGFQHDLVKRHGCDELQGFLVSRPLPAPAFQARFLARRGASVARKTVSQLAESNHDTAAERGG